MSLSRRRSTAVLAALGTAAAAVTAVLLTGGSPAGAAPGTPGCPAEPSFESTIPDPLGAPAAATLPNESVAFVTLGADAKTYYVNTGIEEDPLLVSPLSCFGGGATDNPAVAGYGGSSPTSGIAFVVRSADGRIFLNLANDGGISGWRQLPYGRAAGGPALIGATDGSLSLFVRGSDGALYQAVRSPAGAWTPFRSLGGGFVGTPTVAAKPGGGLIVVVRTSTGLLYSKSSNAAGAFGSVWTKLPGAAAGSPSITPGYAANRLDLFVVGNRGGLYQSAYTAGKFGAFRQVAEYATTRARIAAAAIPGRVIVYVRDDFGAGKFQTGYTQFIAGSGWTVERSEFGDEYLEAPYACPDCAPEVLPTTASRTAAGTRPAQARPLRSHRPPSPGAGVRRGRRPPACPGGRLG